MDINERLKEMSVKDSTWRERAQFHQDNKDWLNLSIHISIKILSKLRNNKKSGTYPSTKEELSEVSGLSIEEINEIVKGYENLTLMTIAKLQKSMDIEIISKFL